MKLHAQWLTGGNTTGLLGSIGDLNTLGGNFAAANNTAIDAIKFSANTAISPPKKTLTTLASSLQQIKTYRFFTINDSVIVRLSNIH